jgi:hypothetical protein
MPLDPRERAALEDAVRITNAVMAGGGDALHVATALVCFAQVIAGDDPCARHVLAWQMMNSADELMDLFLSPKSLAWAFKVHSPDEVLR